MLRILGKEWCRTCCDNILQSNIKRLVLRRSLHNFLHVFLEVRCQQSLLHKNQWKPKMKTLFQQYICNTWVCIHISIGFLVISHQFDEHLDLMLWHMRSQLCGPPRLIYEKLEFREVATNYSVVAFVKIARSHVWVCFLLIPPQAGSSSNHFVA